MTYVWLGLACWVATLIVTDSELFRPVRGYARRWPMVAYLLECPLCTGTWVALAMAAFVAPVVDYPVVGWALTGLTIKAIAHITLVLQRVGETLTYGRDGEA